MNTKTANQDAEIQTLITNHNIATKDGNGNMGPKALAFAMNTTTTAINASIARLIKAGKITTETNHNGTQFYRPHA